MAIKANSISLSIRDLDYTIEALELAQNTTI
jgi:hypothetical protein